MGIQRKTCDSYKKRKEREETSSREYDRSTRLPVASDFTIKIETTIFSRLANLKMPGNTDPFWAELDWLNEDLKNMSVQPEHINIFPEMILPLVDRKHVEQIDVEKNLAYTITQYYCYANSARNKTEVIEITGPLAIELQKLIEENDKRN